jgi:tetratricopeptide (TPR) repeat protein
LLPFLLLGTLLVYQPVWHGGMLWDDDSHITGKDLQSAAGLWRIWFDLGATQQYYPIVHSAFWLQHRLWGDDTLGYHLVNILLHALSAFLIALILRRLSVPGAWLAAVIFALHPVHVESVAWMTELKNTLSGVLALSAILVYLRYDETRERRLYAGALALFVLALLSKTVTATLPAALLVVFWWRRGRLQWRRDVRPLAPFFVLGAAAGLLTAYVERILIGAQGAEFQFTLIERCLIAGRVIWFYLGKLFWPVNLTFIYPRWQVSQGVWWQYLYPLGVLVLLAGLWLMRQRSRAPLAALLLFCGTLFPALGFFNVFPFRFSFVADHFQYLASIGIIAAVSAGMAGLMEQWKVRSRPASAALGVVLAAALAIPAWSQSRQYADAETLYRTTINRNPSCWMAHNNLGKIKLDGRIEEAAAHFRKALLLKPDIAEAHLNLGRALQAMGRLEDAASEYREALWLKPDLAEAHNNLGNALHYLGRLEEAEKECREALRFAPGYPEAHLNLGITLQTLGRLAEAEAHIRDALRLGSDPALVHSCLGRALQGLGRLEEAVAQYQEALRLKPDFAEAHNDLGNVLQGMGRNEEAGAHLKAALRLQPDFPVARYNLGNTLQMMGRLEEAAENYREALRLQPDFAHACNNLGSTLQIMGRLEEAVEKYREALRLKPDYPEARTNLARALALLKSGPWPKRRDR